MTDLSCKDEMRKQAIFKSMSPKRQNQILRKGYDSWDPFQKPKDPIDIRKDKTRRTASMLVREFLQRRSGEDYANEYAEGVFEICLGIVNEDERYRGMYEFSVWYHELLKKEGQK
jgi:hypothetical protein